MTKFWNVIVVLFILLVSHGLLAAYVSHQSFQAADRVWRNELIRRNLATWGYDEEGKQSWYYRHVPPPRRQMSPPKKIITQRTRSI